MAKGNPFKAKGRIHNITMYTLNGEDVMRMIPAHVYNPKTTGQTNHRTKIRMASKFIKSFDSFIKIGYQATSLDNYSNEARQFMIKNCFNITPAGPVFDFPKVLISRGELPMAEGCDMLVEDKSITITWDASASEGRRRKDDRVMVVFYMDEDGGKCVELDTDARRGDRSVILEVPNHKVPVQVWMFFYNAEEAVGESRKKISNSVWLGEIA